MDDLKAQMGVYYDRRAPEYDDWYERRGRYHDAETDADWWMEFRALEAAADSWGRGRVLELAAGTGMWTAHLAARPEVAEVVAVDQSPAMLERGRARVREGAEKVRWVRADAYDLPFREGEFDTLFMGFFLSHVPVAEAPELLRRLTALLRPGGEAGLYDSLLPPGKPEVEVQTRPLGDGSVHDVLKVYYTAATLAELLRPIDPDVAAWDTGRYFVAARWRR